MEEEEEEELGVSQSPDDGGSMKIAGGGDCRGRWGGERGLVGARERHGGGCGRSGEGRRGSKRGMGRRRKRWRIEGGGG